MTEKGSSGIDEDLKKEIVGTFESRVEEKQQEMSQVLQEIRELLEKETNGKWFVFFTSDIQNSFVYSQMDR